MKYNQITPLTWKRFFITLLIVFIASAIRHIFFEGLGKGIPYLTFYPAVMIAAVFGGLYSGLVATTISAFLSYYWIQKGHVSPVEWLAIIVFLISCSMISVISEAMRHANRRAKEEQIKAQNANLAKSAFLANMSHELRTPLNAILGYSELMQQEKDLMPKHHEFLKIINRSGEHLLALINEVLEISKIEAKRTTLDLINFNIHNLIQDVQKMFVLKTNAKGLSFKIQGIEELPLFITADETKLRIILINLIGNAVKFTEKGSITVRFSMNKEYPDKDFLIVEVVDTGQGISENEKDKLFKYFVQTESGKQSKSGTGLGLAISQDYAKLMGGEITFTSISGVGSTFKAKITITEGTALDFNTRIKQSQIIGLAPGQIIPKILVAEDNEENRQLLVKILTQIGFNVQQAFNGKEAVEIFEQWKPNFIWMDIRMPFMDGLEATRIIKASEYGKQTKIVAISAHVLGEEREEIFDAGCEDFVGKPFKMNEIFDMMEKHLNLSYVYEDIIEENEIKLIPSDIPLNLSSLNVELFAELSKAVDKTDAMRIDEIAEQIKILEPALAEALKVCARNFDYETIRIALQRIER